ncbi:hypothetical protein Hamer_G028257 [Homarus americanus]|uniref:Uncharacterized protein n=1 Tax=Homarus americanus TaxID=6706 RepID=A0A8J5N4S3_HOMAM|nr:hypothetical protein Hamer_G028257 [Homarus americanus]
MSRGSSDQDKGKVEDSFCFVENISLSWCSCHLLNSADNLRQRVRSSSQHKSESIKSPFLQSFMSLLPNITIGIQDNEVLCYLVHPIARTIRYSQ